MQNVLLVGLGGALGAVARFAAVGLLRRSLGDAFPFGTLAVNVLGCLLIGLLLGVSLGRLGEAPAWRPFLVVGVLGSFTTFSAFGWETVELLHAADYTRAALSVASNLLLGLGAVWVGVALVGPGSVS